MTYGSHDTIAARATAPGTGAVAIVRLSGPQAIAIAETIAGRRGAPRIAHVCEFRDREGRRIDQGLLLVFPGPGSYTGEDLAELQGHGGPVVSDWLLECAYALGARPAEPGEFTLRAFLNEKLDLTQAEAVADIVASSSRASARAAIRSLTGDFSARVASIQAALTSVRVHVEAHLDFPDEEISPAAANEISSRIGSVAADLDELFEAAERGSVLRDGLGIVIAGPPNAGKSSLLNRLTGYDTAIVTEVPGTTRDTLRETIVLDGLPVNIVDTAGLRETDDPVETEGLRRARTELARSDHVLWITDIREPFDESVAAARAELGDDVEFTFVRNKVDLVSRRIGSAPAHGVATLEISALTGEGIDSLIEHLKTLAGFTGAEFAGGLEGSFSARRRHLDALARARASLGKSLGLLAASPELAAEELRAAQNALGELTGELTSDDLLGEIFSTFCIGK